MEGAGGHGNQERDRTTTMSYMRYEALETGVVPCVEAPLCRSKLPWTEAGILGELSGNSWIML
ncbi:hypothetical protein E2562_007779 [Oryza meyeriana var. granulata]|uniref:Uncharacterized protein n=1 Tax=Oryza meyeriana var. granulata TaxID=110450 RepID=A0A6G1EGU9_9ORYZ|nr:hypothetical protein E2562_007779 [Oryza meyeriana var. granulata]